MKEIINLTPHQVRVHTPEGGIIEIPASGQIARVSTVSTVKQTLENGLELYSQTVGEVQGLPEQTLGVLLLVSAMVRLALPERNDLVSPGELIRDANGQPIGCRGLIIN